MNNILFPYRFFHSIYISDETETTMSTNTKHIAKRSKLTKGNTTYLKDNNRFSLIENDREQRKQL